MKMLSEGKSRWATRPNAWRCQSNRPWALPKPTREKLPLDPIPKAPPSPLNFEGEPPRRVAGPHVGRENQKQGADHLHVSTP